MASSHEVGGKRHERLRRFGSFAPISAEGREQGRAEGHVEAKSQAILTVLEARGLPISPEVRFLVSDCIDPAMLDRWLRRAAVVAKASQVTDEP